MKTIHQTYYIRSTVHEVWKALTDPAYIDAWGGGPAVMDDKVGTEFTLWDGDIHGKNIEVEPQSKLVQEWFGGEWDEPSIATFSLSEEGSDVKVDFVHENVPDAEADSIEEGWQDYYLGPLKDYLEK